MYICTVTKGNNMEYTEEFLRKGHKKEDLIKIILDIQADYKEDRDMLVSQVGNQQKYIKELQSDLKNRDSEYRRWKEYNNEFLTRFMNEYMESERDVIVNVAKEAVIDDLRNNLELDEHTSGDYYSTWTEVKLEYRGETIASTSFSTGK